MAQEFLDLSLERLTPSEAFVSRSISIDRAPTEGSSSSSTRRTRRAARLALSMNSNISLGAVRTTGVALDGVALCRGCRARARARSGGRSPSRALGIILRSRARFSIRARAKTTLATRLPPLSSPPCSAVACRRPKPRAPPARRTRRRFERNLPLASGARARA